MGVYEELVARGLIAQVTDEKEIRELIRLIDEVNRRTILSREINDATARISTLTQIISE